MKQTDLIKGEHYVMDFKLGEGGPNVVAIYEGLHEGALALADGSTYFGRGGFLRFRYQDTRGVDRIALLENGRPVTEAEATRVKREKLEVERQARADAAYASATEFLNRLGLEVVKGRPDDEKPNAVQLRRYTYSQSENVDDIEIENLTIGKLKLAIERGQPIAAR